MTISTPLLDKVNSPADLRKLPESDLETLAKELREFLLYSVSQSGGHFAAGLGTIELTIALHYIYNTPDDNLVWDVGHQAYPHKILTGRKDQMHTIRQWDGVSPFPKRAESEYDAFGVGHSSTSISAALGMSIAARQTGSQKKSVAIIGDGGLTAGMAFEALNNAGDVHADLLVILNDNNMAISPNVGALSNRFAQILSGKLYKTVKDGSKKVLSKVPNALDIARYAEEHVKGLLTPGILFEEFGFNYIGPIDGHDLPTLISTLKGIHDLKGPQFLHIITKKGKGYAPAEAEPIKYHGVTAFDPVKGRRVLCRLENRQHPPIAKYLATGFAISAQWINVWLQSHRPCVRDLAWLNMNKNSLIAILMLVLQNSTVSPLQQAWPVMV